MTLREEAEAAYRAGLNAEIGDPNPYYGSDSLVLCQLWRRGYQKMLVARRLERRATYIADQAQALEPESDTQT